MDGELHVFSRLLLFLLSTFDILLQLYYFLFMLLWDEPSKMYQKRRDKLRMGSDLMV